MNQQDAQSDERFVAVRVDRVGFDDLNPDTALLQHIVQPFLPANYKYINALKVTREIVNGVKYEIVFVMKNELDDEVYCVIDVIEKPWLLKDLNKFRRMTYNNCSLTNSMDDDDRMRFHYEINPICTNQRPQLSQDDVSDMEDQIITDKPRENSSMEPTTTEETTTEDDDDDVTLAPLNPSSKNLLDDFFNMNNYFPPPPSPSTTSTMSPLPHVNFDALDDMFGMKKVEQSNAELKTNDESLAGDDNLQQKRVESIDAVPTKNQTTLKELEVDIKKVFSELFQSDPEFQANIIALINRKDDSTAQKNYNYVISILASKLKDRIETFSERRNDETVGDTQVTVGPMAEPGDERTESGGDVRKRRSSGINVWDLTEEALYTLDRFDSDDNKRVLLNILNVTKNDGKNFFKIEATIADSKCQENSHEIRNCEDKIEPSSKKVCLLEVINVLEIISQCVVNINLIL